MRNKSVNRQENGLFSPNQATRSGRAWDRIVYLATHPATGGRVAPFLLAAPGRSHKVAAPEICILLDLG
jgi:hypothetical protein